MCGCTRKRGCLMDKTTFFNHFKKMAYVRLKHTVMTAYQGNLTLLVYRFKTMTNSRIWIYPQADCFVVSPFFRLMTLKSSQFSFFLTNIPASFCRVLGSKQSEKDKTACRAGIYKVMNDIFDDRSVYVCVCY